MRLFANFLRWTLRHVVALTLIIAILLFARLAAPAISNWLSAQAEIASTAPAQHETLIAAQKAFAEYVRDQQAETRARIDGLRGASDTRLRARIAVLPSQISEARAEQLSKSELTLAAARGDDGRVFRHFKALVETDLLERELSFIDETLRIGAARGRQRADAVSRAQANRARWQAAQRRAEALDSRALAGPRNAVCRAVPLTIGCSNYRALMTARREMAKAAAEHRRAIAVIRTVDAADRTGTAAAALTKGSADAVARQRDAIADELARVETAIDGNWLLLAKRPILEVLPDALLILALAIFGPMLVKAGLYFAVAPIAARRAPMRLLSGERGEAAMAGASAASQLVPIERGETLLLHPEVVQSTPHHARKWTQWLLSGRMPFSSIASGMVGLIGLRANEPDKVLVSATGDPLAEVAMVRLEQGSAMVLRPRALRGLIQPTGQPVRITRHWRLAHLSAWLTLQFRYLVFHGPCTLVVQGTRGVRMERAGDGRGVNQAAIIGFSAGTDYSVSRSEAFGAYLLGKQELYNDSFTGAGFYLYEEMPWRTERGGIWGRGLRGLGDAALKTVGL